MACYLMSCLPKPLLRFRDAGWNSSSLAGHTHACGLKQGLYGKLVGQHKNHEAGPTGVLQTRSATGDRERRPACRSGALTLPMHLPGQVWQTVCGVPHTHCCAMCGCYTCRPSHDDALHTPVVLVGTGGTHLTSPNGLAAFELWKLLESCHVR